MRRIATITFATGAAGLVANLVSGVIMARATGAEGRGSFIAITMGPAVAVWLFAMAPAQAIAFGAGRAPERLKDLVSSWVLLVIPLGLIGMVALELALPLLVGAQDQHVLFLARLWVPTLAFAFLMEIAAGVFLAEGRFGTHNKVRLAQPCLVAAGYAVLAVPGWLTVESALAVWLVTSCVLLVWVLRATGVARSLRRPPPDVLRTTFWFGFRTHWSMFGSIVNARLDLVVLPALVAAAEVGRYSVATNVSWIVCAITAQMGPIALALGASGSEAGDSQMRRAFVGTAVMATFSAAGLFLVAPVALRAIYGPEFVDALGPLRTLLPGAVCFALAQVVLAALYARDRSGLAAVSQMPAVVATVAGMIVLVPGGGIDTAAIVSSSAYALMLVGAGAAYWAMTGWRIGLALPRHAAHVGNEGEA